MAKRRGADVSVARTNPDKLMWPDARVTKSDLIDYYEAVSGPLLEEIQGHPLTVVRAPDGVKGFRFFQKQAPDYTPDWIETVTLPAPASKRKEVRFLLCNRVETLSWLGNQAALELHPSLSSTAQPDAPDALVFDLDPPERGFAKAVKAAGAFRQVLDDLGLRSVVKTTGGKGLHIFVPLDAKSSFQEVYAAAEEIGRRAMEVSETALTFAFLKKDRRGRVLIDIGRNGPGATTVATFSPRARRGAPVSFPVLWSDVDRVDPRDLTIRTAPELLDGPAVKTWRKERRRGQRLPDLEALAPEGRKQSER
ncbi:MAG TPA: non-homologous end-joining DNA ligase [Actinomycetota bacterium]|nr:non-homologous end-joining DNA ligase [Actinomycetota bacterium]